jgi:hypothetical protein
MRMMISLVVEIDENDWPKFGDLPNYVAHRIAGVINEANPSLIKALIEIEDATGVEIDERKAERKAEFFNGPTGSVVIIDD